MISETGQYNQMDIDRMIRMLAQKMGYEVSANKSRVERKTMVTETYF